VEFVTGYLSRLGIAKLYHSILCIGIVNIIKLRAGGRNTHDRKTIVFFRTLPGIQPGINFVKI